VLAYIARVSGGVLAAQMGAKKAQRGAKAAPATRMDESISTALRVKDRLITSTVVTEAFGNAQTLRNDNSSRFGKLMSINFKSSGIAAGGLVQIYLLEKSRVVHQSEGERGFHVCYQLLAGATPEIRRVTKLVGGPEAYAYLSHEYRKIAGVNDAAQFKALVTCMVRGGGSRRAGVRGKAAARVSWQAPLSALPRCMSRAPRRCPSQTAAP
jgi:myosin heavy subunit